MNRYIEAIIIHRIIMKRISPMALLLGLLLAFNTVLFGQDKPEQKDDSIPKPINVATLHSAKIGNVVVNYTATVGTFILKDEKGKPEASFGYVAYTKQGVTDLTSRPLTFAYNGGPGSSSIWLHMGAVGPKRVALDDPNNHPSPPYQLVDNAYSILDVTDLVMVDPVGTGISKAVGKGKNADFWGVDEDIESVGNFIQAYIKKNDRWNSPKFLLGESYGTTRSAGLVDYLQEQKGIAFNGVILISTVLQFNTLEASSDNDLPYILFLPTYAAVAWYHNQLPQKPSDLVAFLDEARKFAGGAYKDALWAGGSLPADKRKELLKKLNYFTGIDESYWDRANLRVSEPQFTAELMRKEGKTTGRLDARYAGVQQDLLSEYAGYDPQSSAITPPYTALFKHYYFGDLNAPQDVDYHVWASEAKDFHWNWNRGHGNFPYGVTTASDLQDAMTKNPTLRILQLNGYFDLATPFYGTEYTFDHLNLPDSIRKNISYKYFDAGHMMYINKDDLPQFKAAIAGFIQGR